MTSILVTPLQPPFRGTVQRFAFNTWPKELALSDTDGNALRELLAGKPVGRAIMMEQEGDKIRISVVH